MNIRPAAPGDLPRCAEIEARCFPPEQAASREQLRDRIAAYGDHFLVGEADGVVLTCLERKLPYYERFGFENHGVSQSVHGGAVWSDMVLWDL